MVQLCPAGFCGRQRTAAVLSSSKSTLSFSLRWSVWISGLEVTPPALLPKPTVSNRAHFPNEKLLPQSQSSITLFPPSDCCLSSFIRLLMVYKLRVMIPPLPSVLWDFLWPFWFCEASFCKWAAISRASRAVCIAAERQEVKLCELCLMWWSHWE